MKSKKVFIAPDMFVAFIDRAHQKHVHASAFFRYFAQEKYLLFTNIITVNQTYNALRQRISSSVAKDFVKALSLGNINILYPEEPDFKNAVKIVTQHQSTELTLEEALIATLCDKRNIPQICTFSYFHQLFGLQTFYLPI